MKARGLFLFLVLVLAQAFCVGTAFGINYQLGGNQLTVHGFLSQGIQFGIVSEPSKKHDTVSDVQQTLTTMFLEVDYRMPSSLSLYASARGTFDWIYEFKSKNNEWQDKGFPESRENLYIDDEWWQAFHEGHLTWSPGTFSFRIGKQIVSWGEMDFIRVMDQINPLDTRRGFSDVEFEETVIPIPVLRAEWWPDVSGLGSFLDQLGVQFIFNPNAVFIPDLNPQLGNDAGGIWAPSFIQGGINYGSLVSNVPDQETWDSDQYEYGLRISGMIGSAIVTLNGFYGRANSPVEKLNLNVIHPAFIAMADDLLTQGIITTEEEYFAIAGEGVALDPSSAISYNPDTMGLDFGEFDVNGNPILHLAMEGEYPRQKFLGATVTTDLPLLRFSFLGGVAPVLRSELKYEFDKLFVELDNIPVPTASGFIESDVLDVAVGLDWKFKFKLLNPRAYIDTSWQIFYKHIMDYPDYLNAAGTPAKIYDIPDADAWTFSAYVQTLYMRARLVPFVAFLFDIDNEGYLLLSGVNFSPSSTWTVGILASWMGGETNKSLDLFDNKDFVALKAKYQF